MRDAEPIESAKGNRLKPNQTPSGPGIFRSGPAPMQLNATTATITKLTPEEQEKFLKEGLCLRCREKGHMARDCPKKVKRN
jgi:hypothetical protein